jgi:hypothetical protein
MNPAAEAIRENPSWARQSKEWFKVALWAFGYSEDVPDRHAVAKALVSSGSLRTHGGLVGDKSP